MREWGKLLFGGVWLLLAGCGTETSEEVVPVVEQPVVVRPALSVGDSAPAIAAEGWVNGAPPQLQPGEVLVIDLWAQWCPFSASTAPLLVEIQNEYRDRGVKFVSLTSDAQEAGERFAKEQRISWPLGYGLTRDMVDQWGARELMSIPGYELKPTLYVLDHAGKVLFCDGHLRHQHAEHPVVREALTKALDGALASPAKPATE